ncbi:MAG: ABC transporter substrate-binding protein [Firmicutes bacterium]|nr:ABC transporter substrate-binding protein [Dethiobacter sp.]MBS3887836.1 ABC transporter substrate-binding protein [Bacillota bacterium]
MGIRLRAALAWGLITVLLVSFSIGVVDSAARAIVVTVDNRPVVFDVSPEIVRGRVMVPIRSIAEMLGATVSWDEVSRTVHIRKSATSISLELGAAVARVDGQVVELDVPAFATRGRTLVPLRFIGEVLGYGVTWHERTARVAVMTKLSRLNMLGPIAPLTFPFYRLGEGQIAASMAQQTQVHIARTVDMLRAQAIDPGMHFAALPTYVAANLYNRGVNLRLVNVAIWGNLYIVGLEGLPVRSLADLRGRRLVIPSRGDTPDLVFRFLAAGKGLDIARDLQIDYVPSPMEAAALLATGRADLAVLSEPAATTALMRAQQEGRRLTRLIELRTVWGEVTGSPTRIPQAGIVALPAVVDRNDLIQAFSDAYDQAALWATANPNEMGALAARGIEGLQGPAAASSLQFSAFRVIPARDVREEIELYFTTLQQMSPDIIGGRLPDARFYWQPD